MAEIVWRETMDERLTNLDDDPRIPVVGILGSSLLDAMGIIVSQISVSALAEMIVVCDQPKPQAWPAELRLLSLRQDELLLARDRSCLCCGLNSELASELSRLFFDVLQRKVPGVKTVVVVSRAVVGDVLAQTLKHAPFLAQRYRLAYCLPPLPG